MIIGSGLILTIFATFIRLAIFGIDLQHMSLGALIIALGMIVDKSIVVVDGASVRMAKGMSRLDAVIDAAKGPSMSLLGATFVALMAFYPIFASVESAGEYCRTLFSVVGMSLLVSWFLSIKVTPLQCVALLKAHDPDADQTESAMIRSYRKVLALAVRFRLATIGVAVVALVSSLVAFGSVTQLFVPTSAMNKFMIDFFAPEGTRIEAVETAVGGIEAEVGRQDGSRP